MSDFDVRPVTSASGAIVSGLGRLLSQLNSRPVPAAAEVRLIVASSTTTVFCAWAGEEMLGTASIATYRTPGGVRGRIEDVVVDADARGQGIGSALVSVCIERARELGVVFISLNSRADRREANRMYQRLGFELLNGDTNCYAILL